MPETRLLIDAKVACGALVPSVGLVDGEGDGEPADA
jgi:hypothetical protein